jgi:hypothetical protein
LALPEQSRAPVDFQKYTKNQYAENRSYDLKCQDSDYTGNKLPQKKYRQTNRAARRIFIPALVSDKPSFHIFLPPPHSLYFLRPVTDRKNCCLSLYIKKRRDCSLL